MTWMRGVADKFTQSAQASYAGHDELWHQRARVEESASPR